MSNKYLNVDREFRGFDANGRALLLAVRVAKVGIRVGMSAMEVTDDVRKILSNASLGDRILGKAECETNAKGWITNERLIEATIVAGKAQTV